jgi:hypothetical protein
LAQQVEAALAALGITRANETLIRELALHLFCVSSRPSAADEIPHEREREKDFLLTADELRMRVADSVEIPRGVSFRPVSRQFPRVCMDVRLERVFDGDAAPLLELRLFPALRRLAGSLPEVLTEARARVVAIRPDTAVLPIHLVVHGVDRILKRVCGNGPRRTRRELEAGIREGFEDTVAACAAFELILTFR